MAPVEALDAAGRFRRVEQLFQRQAYPEAMPLIKALCDDDPKSAKYWGMFALVRLMRSADTAALQDVIDAVNQALRIDEDEPRALYAKALSYKRMGKEREALHYFKRTVSVEPANIDAAREVRLLSMRTADDKQTKR